MIFAKECATFFLSLGLNSLGSKFGKVSRVLKYPNKWVFLQGLVFIFLDVADAFTCLLQKLVLRHVNKIKFFNLGHMVFCRCLTLLYRVVKESDSLSQLSHVDLNSFLGTLNIEGQFFIAISIYSRV